MKPLLFFVKRIHAYAGKVLYVNLFGMTAISFIEGFALLLLIPLLGMVGIGNDGSSGSSWLSLFDFLKDMPESNALALILVAYVLLMVGQSLLYRSLSLRDIRIHTGFINHLRLEIYRAILQSDWNFFIRRRKSDLIHSLTDELGRVTNGTFVFLQFVGSAVFTLIQIGIALWLSPMLTLFVLACGLVIAYLSRAFATKFQALGNRTSELARTYIGGMTDHFNGIKDIKSNMLERSRYEWLQEWSEDISRERFEFAKLRMKSQLYYKVSQSIIVAAFIFMTASWFHVQGSQLLLVILIFSRLWPRFTELQSHREQIASAVPAFKNLTELLASCSSSQEVASTLEERNDIESIRLQHSLECVNVSFRYSQEDLEYALKNINATIRANETTAIIGRSGAGKSTLIDVLMGLLRPERGEVLVDGIPLTDGNLLSLRQAISYIPQDPFLFNGTIRENMQLMASGASEQDMWEALSDASAQKFVERLPQGLDTVIGDRGIRLSGGERQRLVLARTLLRKPSILVLDEATSALDAENEASIQAVLERLKGTMTMIVVAHRLSTIRNADQVIVLDHGSIVQTGQFDQLARERDGVFAGLLSRQAQRIDNFPA
ncbi:ABC transporter ATP-binding protein [Cohnella soli]|uniref:ABC transporter ATP-binding protein n=1 Tax=Cohnella soli TaxID=425005 RepID=A0ABW0HZV2_9BACL